MPRKSKEIKAAKHRDQQQRLDGAVKKLSPAQKERMNTGARVNLTTDFDDKNYYWRGLKEEQDGSLSRSANHGKAPNDNRHKMAMDLARNLLKQYGEHFWERSYTNEIARDANVTPRTIRNYRERLREENGKAK